MIEHAKIVEGLEISIHALIQSINGLTRREEKLLGNGQVGHAATVRNTIEKLHVLRSDLMQVLNEQKSINTDLV